MKYLIFGLLLLLQAVCLSQTETRDYGFQLEDSTFLIGDRYRTYKVIFEGYCYTKVSKSSEETITEISEFLVKNNTVKVEIGYHLGNDTTLYSGCSPTLNAAESVKKELVALGIENERMTVIGYGNSHPCCTHPYRNQRLEIKVTEK